jgi:hypothetical protein
MKSSSPMRRKKTWDGEDDVVHDPDPIDSSEEGGKPGNQSRARSSRRRLVAPAAPLHPRYERRLAPLVRAPLEDDLHLGQAVEELAQTGEHGLALRARRRGTGVSCQCWRAVQVVQMPW